MDRRQHDIERYLRGEMTRAEMHAFEKEAVNDPFLSDALEGAQHAGTEDFLRDLNKLRASVKKRTKARRPKIFPTWNWSIGIAAGLILIGLASVYIIGNIKPKTEQNAEVVPEALPYQGEISAVDSLAERGLSQLATPRDGKDAFFKYVYEKIKCPAQKTEAEFLVEFNVNVDGKLSDFKVLKSIGDECDNELIRVINDGPTWIPSKQNDQPLPDKVKLRFQFIQ